MGQALFTTVTNLNWWHNVIQYWFFFQGISFTSTPVKRCRPSLRQSIGQEVLPPASDIVPATVDQPENAGQEVMSMSEAGGRTSWPIDSGVSTTAGDRTSWPALSGWSTVAGTISEAGGRTSWPIDSGVSTTAGDRTSWPAFSGWSTVAGTMSEAIYSRSDRERRPRSSVAGCQCI